MLARSQFSPTLAHVRKVYVLVFFLSEDDPHHPWLSPYERRDLLINSSASAGDRRAAEQRDELAAFHSITSSASASRFGGISRPSVLAVLRLMTSSSLFTCSTGKSAGLMPLRIRPA